MLKGFPLKTISIPNINLLDHIHIHINKKIIHIPLLIPITKKIHTKNKKPSNIKNNNPTSHILIYNKSLDKEPLELSIKYFKF